MAGGSRMRKSCGPIMRACQPGVGGLEMRRTVRRGAEVRVKEARQSASASPPCKFESLSLFFQAKGLHGLLHH